MSVMAGVNDAVISIRDKLRGKIGQTKVKRYMTGKPPEWPDHDHAAVTLEQGYYDHIISTTASRGDLDTTINIDPRLRRLAKSKIDNGEVIRADHRRILEAEQVVSTMEGLDLEEQDEDALEDRRRRRIREKFLLQCQKQEEEEEESEYGTDSEKELTCINVMVKPVFVPMFERDTIAERERLEAEEQALEDMMRRLLEERKVETKQIVVAGIRKDEEIQQNLEMEADIADVDTDDEVNEAKEYEAWKVREIARIKKDRDAREATMKEKEELENGERMKNSKPLSGSKRKWGFMHKFYYMLE